MNFLNTLVIPSILIGITIVARGFLKDKLPKKTFVVMWLICMVRLLVPIEIKSALSIYNFTDFGIASNASAVIPVATPVLQQGGGEFVQNSTQIQPESTSISPLLIIWLCGVLCLTLYFALTHIKYKKLYNTAIPVKDEYILQTVNSFKLRRKIRVCTLDTLSVPLTYGIFKPVVLIPKSMIGITKTKLKYVLYHEIYHIKHFDVLTKLFLAVVLAIFWYNPLVWVMYILANKDIELACDESVLNKLNSTKKACYAYTLIGMAQKQSTYYLCNNFSKNAIEERIKSIMKHKKFTIGAIIIAALLVFSVTTAFATTGISKEYYTKDGEYKGPEFFDCDEFGRYEELGLRYDKSDGLYYYKNEVVGYFADELYKDKDGNAVYNHFSQTGGMVGINVVRNASNKITAFDLYDIDVTKENSANSVSQEYSKSSSGNSGSASTGKIEFFAKEETAAEVEASENTANEQPVYESAVATADEDNDFGDFGTEFSSEFSFYKDNKNFNVVQDDAVSTKVFPEVAFSNTKEYSATVVQDSAINSDVSNDKEYKEYQKFGITQDSKNPCMYYKNKHVSFLYDKYNHVYACNLNEGQKSDVKLEIIRNTKGEITSINELTDAQVKSIINND